MDDCSHDARLFSTFLSPGWSDNQIDFLRSNEGAAFCTRMRECFDRISYIQDFVHDAIRTGEFQTGVFIPANPLPEHGSWNNMILELSEKIGIDVQQSASPLFRNGNQPNVVGLYMLDRMICERSKLLSKLMLASEGTP